MASPSTTARSRTPRLDADDALALRTAELAAWARRNARTVMIAAGVVVAVVLVAFFVRYQNQRKADRAAEEWLSVQAAAAQGPSGIAQLAAFATSFDGTAEADVARLAMAQMYLEQNQPQQAVNQARRVADGGGVMDFQGRMMLGAALAASNQKPQAIEAYLKAAEGTDLVYQRQEARSEAALLHEESGNWAGAAQVYRSMLPDAKEGTLDRAVVDLRLAEAESHLGGRR
jgi:predicted negative regulator of RcsB-dependent stress response